MTIHGLRNNLKNLKVNTAEIIYWFNALRNLPEGERTRALDAFWAGQIDSKVWLVEELLNNAEQMHISKDYNIYIFGGWIGILASLLLQSDEKIGKIRSIDLDPWCESIADMICKPHEMNEWRFKSRTADMMAYEYEWGIRPHVVINTSTEHVDQDTYNAWYNRIPNDTWVIAQGNDFFECNEHVRSTKDLNVFMQINKVSDPVFAGELPHDLYTRFMCIWKKN